MTTDRFADLMTPAQLGELWQLDPKTLGNWRSKRTGPPYVKIGGKVRYSRIAVAAWLDEQNRDRAATA